MARRKIRSILPSDVQPASNATPSTESDYGFLNDDVPTQGYSMRDDATYYNTIKALVIESRQYIDDSIEPEVRRGYRYYNGSSDVPRAKGRSGIVMTEVRDTIDRAVPQILNIFMTNPNAVEFEASSEFNADYARLQTMYCNYIFHKKNDSAIVLHDFVKDALQAKRGVIKHYVTMDETLASTDTYHGLTTDERHEVVSRPNTTIMREHMRNLEDGEADPFTSGSDVGTDMPLEHNKPTDPGQIAFNMARAHSMLAASDDDTSPWRHDMTTNTTKQTRKIVIEVVPPEEFIIHRTARCVADAVICGHDRMLPRSDLVEMGYSQHEVAQAVAEHMREPSAQAMQSRHDRQHRLRQTNIMNNGEGAQYADPARDTVRYMELYVRIDRDCDGIAELRKVVMAGANYLVMFDEPAEYNPFTVSSAIRIQHTVIGDSMADITMDLQDINTAMFRSIIDNANFSNVPRIGYIENAVEPSDLQNIYPGATIRMRQQGALQPITIPFTAANSMPIMQYLEQRKEARTGISAQSAGLDADALQSSTEIGVRAIVGSSQLMVQLMSRMLAETGLKPLFRAIAMLAKKYMPEELVIAAQHAGTKINPSDFDPEADIIANVGLGTGSLEMRMQALTTTYQAQTAVLSSMVQLGITPDKNPLVGLDEYRNTLQDMLALAGIKDVSRYYKQNPAHAAEQIMQQLAQQKQNQPNPDMMKLQIDQQSAQLDMQIKQQTAQQDMQHKQELHQFTLRSKQETHNMTMQQHQQKVQADIAQHNAVTTAGIRDNQQETVAGIQNDAAKTAADIELARQRADRASQEGNNS